jgi:hypothetical protein
MEAQQEEDERKNSRNRHVSPVREASFLREKSKRRPHHERLVVGEEPARNEHYLLHVAIR